MEVIAHLAHLVPGLVPLGVRGRPVEHLEPVALAEGQLGVGLGLEGVQGDHHVQHVLGHAVGVRVVYLLLGVVRGEPAHLERARERVRQQDGISS